jgi:Cu(I)/Ag(I) efflux system protein CusF
LLLPALLTVGPPARSLTSGTTDLPNANSPIWASDLNEDEDEDEEEHTLNVFKRMAAGALMMTVPVTAAVAQSAIIEGVVDKINESSANITLKHGPAPSLGFKEAVTMVYEVSDRAMLKQLKVGDKVKFEAEGGDEGFMVTKIEKSGK